MLGTLARRQDPFAILFDSMLPWYENEDYLKSKVDSTANELTFTLEVPGFEEKEIDIELRDRTLKITAEHREDSHGKHFHKSIYRAWSLPRGLNEEQITATLKNGILTVAVPRKELTEGKKIEVKALTE